MISIALCTYNGESYIDELLLSITNQTFQPDEIIICDDKSTDDTVSKIKSILDDWTGNYRLIVNESNLGYKKNFQKAISLCDGDIIFLCDQDDVWDATKIAKIMTVFNHHDDVLMVFHDAELVDENLDTLSPSLWKELGFDYHSFFNGDFSHFVKGNMVQGAACAFKKELFDISLPFPINAIHDEWLALNAMMNGKIYPLHDALLKYRQTGKNEIGATNKSFFAKVKGLDKLSINLKHRFFELDRYTNVWNALSGKYILDDKESRHQYLKLISNFYSSRREAIFQHKLNKLPPFFDYVNMYNNRTESLSTYVKDIVSIFGL